MKRFLARFATAALVVGGLGFIGTSPAVAAACSASPIHTWQAYNNNCSYVVHWDRLPGSVYKYGSSVTPQQWSTQLACWADVESYGANKGVLVNWV